MVGEALVVEAAVLVAQTPLLQLNHSRSTVALVVHLEALAVVARPPRPKLVHPTLEVALADSAKVS